jgi:hypothetical protein
VAVGRTPTQVGRTAHMSLAWMTVDYRSKEWPRVKPNLRSRITIARWYVRAAWRWAAGFVTGFALALALLHLIEARAKQEIILDFTTAPAITAPASADSGLLLSFSPHPRLDPRS